MLSVTHLSFNMFQVNTYFVFDENKECIIIDPGCENEEECIELTSYIGKNGLRPTRLINTHCHIDHILGNQFVFDKYHIHPEFHKDEEAIYASANSYSQAFGFSLPVLPVPGKNLKDQDLISFKSSSLIVLHTPGHTLGHITLYSALDKFIICGDVLFYGSIGRTDLPGGNYEQLIKSIKEKLLILDNEVVVYPGHGCSTTIGYEKINNPFLI